MKMTKVNEDLIEYSEDAEEYREKLIKLSIQYAPSVVTPELMEMLSQIAGTCASTFEESEAEEFFKYISDEIFPSIVTAAREIAIEERESNHE